MKSLKKTAFIALISVFYCNLVLCQNLNISDTNRVKIITLENILPINLDIDTDGFNDFTIYRDSMVACDRCTSKWIAIKNLTNFYILNNDLNEAIGLYVSDTIQDKYHWPVPVNWSNSHAYGFKLKGNMCTMPCGTTTERGFWNFRPNPCYIGVRKIIDNDTIGGWIKIGFNTKDSMIQYAYEKDLLNTIVTKKELSYKIYPTTVKDFINVDQIDSFTKLELFNNSGQIIMTEYLNSYKNRISLDRLKKGFYYLRISNNNLVSTYKILKI